MNTARSHAQAVWRTSQTQNILNPDGSIGKIEVCSATVDSIEGAIQAYHQEATADLQSEHAREIRRLNAALDFMRCQVDGSDQIIRTNVEIIRQKSAEIARLKERERIFTDYLSEAKRQRALTATEGDTFESWAVAGAVQALEGIQEVWTAVDKRNNDLAAAIAK